MVLLPGEIMMFFYGYYEFPSKLRSCPLLLPINIDIFNSPKAYVLMSKGVGRYYRVSRKFVVA